MGGVEERPAKGFRASGKAMEEARRYRQSLLGFPYAHEGLGNRHTAAASRKQAACQGDTCRMASVPVGGGRAAVRYPLKTRMELHSAPQRKPSVGGDAAMPRCIFPLKFRDGYGAAPLDIT